MGNYSDDARSVRVDFFKPSGKRYMTEAIQWPSVLAYESGQLIDQFDYDPPSARFEAELLTANAKGIKE